MRFRDPIGRHDAFGGDLQPMTTTSHLIGRLRFRHLALLVALDDHRNLRRAADAVHLAQPSATKLVHDLEQVFGFPIFERLPRGMEPTDVGKEVLVFARRTLADLDRFTLDLDSKCKRATMKISAPSRFASLPAENTRCTEPRN
jgi:DNA-binding transcriptional LysR family regulator